jgi:quinol monooxygenase YgiN
MQIVVPDERRTAVLRALGSMLGPTRVAPGCLDARLYSDLDKRKTLLLVEDWVVRVDAVEREEGVDALALHRSIEGTTK